MTEWDMMISYGSSAGILMIILSVIRLLSLALLMWCKKRFRVSDTAYAETLRHLPLFRRSRR